MSDIFILDVVHVEKSRFQNLNRIDKKEYGEILYFKNDPVVQICMVIFAFFAILTVHVLDHNKKYAKIVHNRNHFRRIKNIFILRRNKIFTIEIQILAKEWANVHNLYFVYYWKELVFITLGILIMFMLDRRIKLEHYQEHREMHGHWPLNMQQPLYWIQVALFDLRDVVAVQGMWVVWGYHCVFIESFLEDDCS